MSILKTCSFVTIVIIFFYFFSVPFSFSSIPLSSLGPKSNNKAIRLFTKGKESQINGKIQEAISYYSSSIEVEASPGAYNNRGMLYAELRDFEQALSDYNNAVKLAPNRAHSYTNRSEVWTVLKKYDNALSDNNRAIELDSRNDVAYNNRGFYFWQIKKDFKAALRDFNKAIELNPSLPQSYLNRAAIYDLLNYDQKNIIHDLTIAISLDSKYAKAYLKRGVAYQKEKKYEKAKSDYSKVIELDKDSIIGILALFSRANLKAQSGYMESAFKDIDLFIKKMNGLDSNSMLGVSVALNDKSALSGPIYDGYILRGKLHIVLKRYKEAKEDFKKAIRLFPDSQMADQLLRTSEKYLSQADE